MSGSYGAYKTNSPTGTYAVNHRPIKINNPTMPKPVSSGQTASSGSDTPSPNPSAPPAAAKPASTYQTQQVLTRPKEELPLLLYGGAIRFINQSIQAIEKGNQQEAHNSNLRAQDIVTELRSTLDMNIEVSKSLSALYEYIQYRLVQGNIQKDIAQLEEARTMFEEMRDTWAQAVKIARKERGVVNE
ncbi:flagellar export chaperone FliS [Heliorestis convoluta]|uniref:Flagellar protein FliS n=1 Tax=Heliorestis convoluta TaxID=356322 RepID=A0A5Q2N129_9FIRM|nr:flagellar export chaperone FliS [Heliorestis convoluta]QGG47503.1 Flagellar protein FliS [Heliorestis convoluta]